MDLMGILMLLLFGAVIGFVAGLIMKSKGSLVKNIIIGILGSFLGGWVASLLNFGTFGGASFDVMNIVISVGGACLLIVIARALKITK